MNRKTLYKIALAPILLLTTTGWQAQPPNASQSKLIEQAKVNSQPADERAAQDALPKSSNPLWSTLAQSKVSFSTKTGNFSIVLPPEVKALDGQTVTVSGFVLPMDGSDHTKHFLVTKNTPVCMFCPPGEPNEVVEVVSPQAVAWTNKMVSVTGKMSLINNGEKALFFKIAAAEVK